MQDSHSSALQRGHRFPRPTTAAAATTITVPPAPTSPTAPTQAPTSATTCESSAESVNLEQQQLQFHLQSELPTESHASQSLTTLLQLEDPSQAIEHLQPPTCPPPPVPFSPVLTPEIQSPTHSTNRQLLALAHINESVASAPSRGLDDLSFSTEHSPVCTARPISQDLSEEATEAALRIAAQSLRKQGSVASNPDTESPISNSSHQRRIHYVPEGFHDDLSLTTEATEHSYDTDNELAENSMPAFGDLTMDEEMEPTIMTTTNAEKREHLYKILVIGELGTGKTSFIKRYVHQFFSQNYRATIGVDFALKVLHWDANTIVRLQLWDIAGQERFGNMTRVYYKEAVGAFIVFDVTRTGTFDCVSKWKEDLDSKVQLPDGSPIPCILLANKCDQEKQGIVTQPEKMEEYVHENGFAGWFETSAKENINIDEAARALVSKILLNDKLITAGDLADSEKFNLNKSAEQTDADNKGKCPC